MTRPRRKPRKPLIGSRVPPHVSLFEHRDWNGSYRHTLPPILGDAQSLQSALLQRERASRLPSLYRKTITPFIGALVLIALYFGS